MPSTIATIDDDGRMRYFLLLLVFSSSHYFAATNASEVDYDDLLREINRHRQSLNLPGLCVSDRLTEIAQRYSDYQAAHSIGGHYADGRTPQQRTPDASLVQEILFEGGMAKSMALITKQFQTTGLGIRTVATDGRLTHFGVGRSATTDQNNQPYYYLVILMATLPGEPCPDRWARGNNLAFRSQLHSPPSIPEYVAPPEQRSLISKTIQRPAPGRARVEKVEQVDRLYTDTIPRVVSPGEQNSIAGSDETVWRGRAVNLPDGTMEEETALTTPEYPPRMSPPDPVPLFWA